MRKLKILQHENFQIYGICMPAIWHTFSMYVVLYVYF